MFQGGVASDPASVVYSVWDSFLKKKMILLGKEDNINVGRETSMKKASKKKEYSLT